MATFQKPENALKRAEELEAVGQTEDALQTLQAAIAHKKFRAQGWTQVLEKIMLKFVDLCAESQKLRAAKDGIMQYRGISQANIGSLETVILRLRDRAEERLAETRKRVSSNAELQVEDLDAEESPESVLLSAVQDGREAVAKDAHKALRFVWETYKTILDILRNNGKLERVYHETAAKAFDFCQQNQRPQELKRLCEMIRTHFSHIQKNVNATPGYVTLSNPDTIQFHLDTRFTQLKAADDLELYRECFATAEDIHALMSKAQSGPKKPKPQLFALYFEKLTKIFWVAEAHLFHATAWLKQLQQHRTFKKTIKEDELQAMSSAALLAVLSIPLTGAAASPSTAADRYGSGDADADATQERQRRMAALLNVATVPTRDSLKAELAAKKVIEAAHPACKALYALIENDFTPLSLCQDCKPLLDSLPANLAHYAVPIKRVVFHKLLQQLAKVYTNISIEHFSKVVCPPSFLPWSEAEKVMVGLVHAKQVPLRVDYVKRALFFAASPNSSDPSAALQHQLAELGGRLSTAAHLIAPMAAAEASQAGLARLMETLTQRLREERKRVQERQREIQSRQAEREKEQRTVEAEQRRRAEIARQQEAEREKVRQDEERKKREAEKLKEEKMKKEQEQAAQVLESIKKMSANSKITIAGKKLEDLKLEELTDKRAELEKAQEQQRLRERQERVRGRRAEAKRVDHLVRALREEGAPLLAAHEKAQAKADEAFIKEVHAKKDAEAKQLWETQQAEKALFLPVAALQKAWLDKQMAARKAEHAKLVAEQHARLDRVRWERKVQRAEERKREDDARREEEEEEARRAEEEEAAAREEEERMEEARRKREADEEKRRKLDELAERQRQKEREIEERARGGRSDDRSDRRRDDSEERRPARRTDDRRDDRDDRRDDGWRRGDDRRDDRDRSDRRRDDRDDRRDDRHRDDRDDRRDDGWRRDEPRRDDRRSDDRDRKDRDEPRHRDDRRDDRREEPSSWRREEKPRDEEPAGGWRGSMAMSRDEFKRKPQTETREETPKADAEDAGFQTVKSKKGGRK